MPRTLLLMEMSVCTRFNYQADLSNQAKDVELESGSKRLFLADCSRTNC